MALLDNDVLKCDPDNLSQDRLRMHFACALPDQKAGLSTCWPVVNPNKAASFEGKVLVEIRMVHHSQSLAPDLPC